MGEPHPSHGAVRCRSGVGVHWLGQGGSSGAGGGVGGDYEIGIRRVAWRMRVIAKNGEGSGVAAEMKKGLGGLLSWKETCIEDESPSSSVRDDSVKRNNPTMQQIQMLLHHHGNVEQMNMQPILSLEDMVQMAPQRSRTPGRQTDEAAIFDASPRLVRGQMEMSG